MPQVPYTPYPTVQPTEAGTPGLRVATPGAAFGETVAGAVEHMGGSLEHAGNELWNRAVAIKETENRADADQAFAKAVKDMGTQSEQFRTLQGKSASEGLDPHLTDLEKTRASIAQSLDNPQARRFFDSESRGLLSRLTVAAAGHAAQQQKQYVNSAAEASKDAIKEQALKNPMDQRGFDDYLRQGESIIKTTQAGVHGWGPEKTTEEVGKFRSSMMLLRIEAVGEENPGLASDMLKANQGLMRAEDWIRAQKFVKTQLDTTTARMVGDQWNSPEKKDLTEGEKLEGAEKDARKISDDPVFLAHVRTATRARHHEMLEVHRENERQAFETVQDGIINSDATRFEQLRVNPNFMKAWNTLSEKQQQAALNDLADKARGDYKKWTPEMVDRLQVLYGKSSDKNSDFLDIPIASEKIPWKDKQKLNALQKSLRGGAAADPRVNHAMSVLESDLAANQLLKSQNKEDYYKLRGAVQDALNYHQDELGKKLGDKEILEIGRRLIQDVEVKKGMFEGYNIPGVYSKAFGLGPLAIAAGTAGLALLKFGGTEEKFFKMTIPDEEVKKTQQEIQAKTGRTPPADEVQRAFIRKQYIEKFGGAAKKPEVKVPKLGG